MVRLDGPDTMVVKKLNMIMVECVVRGYLYGSLFERLNKGEVSLPVPKVLASKLPAPYFDPTTKSEVHDEPITEAQIIHDRLMTAPELKQVKAATVQVYEKMSQKAKGAGFILADLKLEFGKDANGKILMADSIGRDEFRMWPAASYAPGKTQESYDKQPVRDWLQSSGYKAKLDAARKAGQPTPPPPELPRDLVEEVSRRYVHVYESITGRKSLIVSRSTTALPCLERNPRRTGTPTPGQESTSSRCETSRTPSRVFSRRPSSRERAGSASRR